MASGWWSRSEGQRPLDQSVHQRHTGLVPGLEERGPATPEARLRCTASQITRSSSRIRTELATDASASPSVASGAAKNVYATRVDVGPVGQ